MLDKPCTQVLSLHHKGHVAQVYDPNFIKEMGPHGLTTSECQSQDLNPSSSLQRESASSSVFLFHLLYKYLTQLAPTNSKASKASALKVTVE